MSHLQTIPGLIRDLADTFRSDLVGSYQDPVGSSQDPAGKLHLNLVGTYHLVLVDSHLRDPAGSYLQDLADTFHFGPVGS